MVPEAFTGVTGGNPVPQYGLFFTLPVLGGPVCYGFTDCGLAQTWSLVVELTFYAVLPLYALAMVRLTRRLALRTWMRVEIAILALLGAASLLFMFVLVPADGPSLLAQQHGGRLVVLVQSRNGARNCFGRARRERQEAVVGQGRGLEPAGLLAVRDRRLPGAVLSGCPLTPTP